MRSASAASVRSILKPKSTCTWSPSISQSKGRNLLPSFSQIRSQAHACARDRDTLRFRVLASSNSSFLRRHCSFHHSPLDISATLMASSSENAPDHYRLPTEVRPRHYDLTIRTDLEKEKFTGFVKIECVQCPPRIVDRRALACQPQPRNRASNQSRYLQFRGRAFAGLGDPRLRILRQEPCTCRDKVRCLHRARVIDIRRGATRWDQSNPESRL